MDMNTESTSRSMNRNSGVFSGGSEAPSECTAHSNMMEGKQNGCHAAQHEQAYLPVL